MFDIPAGELIGLGGPAVGVVAIMGVCWRLFDSIWERAAKTLRDSADYANKESAELRARLDEIEAQNIALTRQVLNLEAERAMWSAERSMLETRVGALELQLEGRPAGG